MDVYQSIVFPKILKLSSFITAQYTIFGWLLYGQADSGANVTAYLTLHSVSEDTSNVYSPLPDILLRFRLHKIGLTADVSKMFRMIELHPIDRDLHRFLWTTDSSHMVDCRMTRLTFGITSSPFIAAQTLQRIASDNAELYPQAAEVVQKNFYVDDCLTGAESVTEATELRAQLNGLLGQGNMQLRKWRSSSRSVIDSVPEDLREQEVVQELPTPNELHKALGIYWDTCRDSLHISTSSLKPSEELTKRNLTSDIARTFDVLGWIAPAILLLKLLMQRFWELQLAWDDPVPDSIATIWLSWRNQIPALAKRPIPRCYFSLDQDRLSVQLHGFADASESAYAAVVYIRTVYLDTTTEVKLVIAKTRVAPLKRLTIPRLKLCAAQLLAKLLDTTRRALSIPLQDVYCWTDATIVLAWLDGQPDATRPTLVIESVPHYNLCRLRNGTTSLLIRILPTAHLAVYCRGIYKSTNYGGMCPLGCASLPLTGHICL